MLPLPVFRFLPLCIFGTRRSRCGTSFRLVVRSLILTNYLQLLVQVLNTRKRRIEFAHLKGMAFSFRVSVWPDLHNLLGGGVERILLIAVFRLNCCHDSNEPLAIIVFDRIGTRPRVSWRGIREFNPVMAMPSAEMITPLRSQKFTRCHLKQKLSPRESEYTGIDFAKFAGGSE